MKWQKNSKRIGGVIIQKPGRLAAQLKSLHQRDVDRLLNNASDQTSGNSATTLTDVEALTGLGGNGAVGGQDHLDVVTGLNTAGLVLIGEGEVTGLIGSTQVNLGAVVATETSAATTLGLSQDVHGDQELAGGLGGARGGNDHTTADVLTADTTDQQTGVVTGAGLVASLLEGLNVGNLGLDGGLGATNNLDLSILLQETTLDTARDDSTTTGDGENFLDGHQEGLVKVTLGGRDPSINGVHEVVDALGTDIGAAVLKGAKGRAEDDRGLLTLEAVGGEKLTHLKLDKLQHLRVLDSVDLVNEDNNLLDTDLTGKQQVLTGLGPVKKRTR